MPVIKHRDWSGWLEGMRSKAFKAGAEAISTNVTALLGTNGVAAMGIPGFSDIGMGWKTAVATTLIQFTLRVVAAAAMYVRDKPDPDVITETIQTEHINRDSVTGVITETGSSKTVTTTPTESKKP